jgi:hypothetical protein
MVFAAIGLIVLGLLLLFIVPWVGIIAGIVGLILVVLYLVGVGRRVAETETG